MGTKSQRAVYEWVNISDDLVYEWVNFFKGQVYDSGRVRNTGLSTHTTITPKLLPPTPPHTTPIHELSLTFLDSMLSMTNAWMDKGTDVLTDGHL